MTESNNRKSTKRFPHPKGWTPEEKRIFLHALRAYGHKNINKICLGLPFHSKQSVKKYIEFWKRSASTSVLKRLDLKIPHIDNENYCPLNQWLTSLSHHSERLKTVIPCALELIAHYEKHLEPEQSNSVDFKLLYSFLAESLRGNTPKMKDKACKTVVGNSLVALSAENKCTRRTEDIEFVQNITRLFPDSTKISLNQLDNDQYPQHIKEIQSQFAYNPLGLQLSALRNQEMKKM